MNWRSPSAFAVTAFYLAFLAFGIYVDLEEIFGFLGTWILVLVIHLGLGAFLNRWDAALLPFLGGPIAIPASSDTDTPAWALMLWFAPFFALLILCGLAGRRIVDKWTSEKVRLVKR
jgi:hypothetical protein